MRAGGVIRSMGDSQDIRFMGGFSLCMPFTSSCLMVSNFALCGIPFLSGFYFRVFILEMFFMRYFNIFGLAHCERSQKATLSAEQPIFRQGSVSR